MAIHSSLTLAVVAVTLVLLPGVVVQPAHAHWNLKRLNDEYGNTTSTGIIYNKKNSLCTGVLGATEGGETLQMLKGAKMTPVGGIAHGSGFMNVWFSPLGTEPESKSNAGTLWRRETLRGTLSAANVGPPEDAETGVGTLTMCQKDVYCQCVQIEVIDEPAPPVTPDQVKPVTPIERDENGVPVDADLQDQTGPDDIADMTKPCGGEVNGFCPTLPQQACVLASDISVRPWVFECVEGATANDSPPDNRDDGPAATAMLPATGFVVAAASALFVVVATLAL